VRAFEEGLLKYYHNQVPELREQLARERQLSDELDAKLKEAVARFKQSFVAGLKTERSA